MQLMKDDFVLCDTCRKYTDQSLVKEFEDLAIKSRDSVLQKFQCGECKRINERLLQYCSNCGTHTEQTLNHEKPSDLIAETLDQEFRCNVCQNTNETSQSSDEHIERFLNRKDEEGGVYCNYCMANKTQELIDKRPLPDGYGQDFDLTTYRCKTCRSINYGTEAKRDIR